jgi:hypothetical protein
VKRHLPKHRHQAPRNHRPLKSQAPKINQTPAGGERKMRSGGVIHFILFYFMGGESPTTITSADQFRGYIE